MRKDCVLSKLPEEKLAEIFDSLSTLSYEEVQKQLAQPPPDGIGERVYVNTLFRFFEKRQAKIQARDLANVMAASQNPKTAALNSEAAQKQFSSAAQLAFAHSTYVLAHSPLTPANYRAVARALRQFTDASIKREFVEIALQQLALARERLQFDREQFEYNAARAALALLPELNEIDRRADLDDEAKIWRARARLFGPDSSGSPPNPGVPAGVPAGPNQSVGSA